MVNKKSSVINTEDERYLSEVNKQGRKVFVYMLTDRVVEKNKIFWLYIYEYFRE